MQSPPAPLTVLNGREYLYFAGTGYLGLQGHPDVIAAANAACLTLGTHSATTRSGFGTSPAVSEVEARIAEFLEMSQGCYLVSGYAVNFALTAALSSRVDMVLIDESAHDCLRESVRWLDALKHPPVVFRHRDSEHVAQLLNTHLRPGWRPLLMTDGVFAASGRLAPLREYLEILDARTGAMLLVDDAHGLATLGENGRGSLELAGVAPSRINTHELDNARTAVFHGTTLSKAIGGHGGGIVGTPEFLLNVRQSSGWFRGSSAPAAPVAGATAKALEIVQTQPELRARLATNVRLARTGLRSLGLEIDESASPVIGFVLPQSAHMSGVQSRLLEAGIAIAYTRDYAGAGPDGMLRVAVFATHTPEMIGRLVTTLGEFL